MTWIIFKGLASGLDNRFLAVVADFADKASGVVYCWQSIYKHALVWRWVWAIGFHSLGSSPRNNR